MKTESGPETLPTLLATPIQNAARVLLAGSIAVLGCIGWGTHHSPQNRGPAEHGSSQSDFSQSDFRIDLNQAGVRELTLMPGIGAATAEKIIADRNENGRYRSLNDLQRVPGIGPKTIRQLAPYCVVDLVNDRSIVLPNHKAPSPETRFPPPRSS